MSYLRIVVRPGRRSLTDGPPCNIIAYKVGSVATSKLISLVIIQLIKDVC
jgi:hypothetical protein